MVCFVWNNLATMPHPTKDGEYTSRTAILENHEYTFDVKNLRAFGTKCYWLLTLEKKGGKKQALLPKAKAGVIIGIEDGMPAYRVFDLEKRKMRRIPFAQAITHEGCYPFRDSKNLTPEEHSLPPSFLLTPESFVEKEVVSSDDAELWGARDEDDDVYDSHSVGHLSTGGVSSSAPHSSTVLPAPPHSTSTPASTSTTTTSTVQRHRRSSSPPAAATASSRRSPSRRSSSHSVRGAPTRSVSPITTPLLEPVEAVALDQPSHTVEGPRMYPTCN